MTLPDIAALVMAVAAVAGLCLHVMKYAYDKGVNDNRLTNIETAQTGFGNMQALVSSIQATMTALNSSVARLDRAVESLSKRA